MKPLRNPLVFRLCLFLGAIVVLGGGYYLLRYQAWAAYRNWSIARMNGMAREFVAADDPRNALLTVRKVLRKRPNDVEAWRIGVQAALQRDSAESVHFQRNLARVERTLPNQLELMRLAVNYRLYGVALDTVSAVGAEARLMPEYHRLAAATYRGVGRDLSAKYHLVSLLGLTPDDAEAGVALAEIEFETEANRLPADWTARVRRLSQAPGGEPAASLLLLRHAAARKAESEVAPLVSALMLRTDLTLAQRLQLLGAIPARDEEKAARVLAAAQAQAESKPEETVQVMQWLDENGRSDALIAWYPKLPEETRKMEPVRLATARALDAKQQWTEVERILTGARWTRAESLRLALLARSFRMRGRNADFAETWKLALIASGTEVTDVVRLHQLVKGWQWNDERIDVLWKLFNLVPTSRTVRDELVAYEYRRGNTVNLNKIYARLVDAAPGDDEARNNFAYTSLLLNTNLTRAHAMARDLHRKHPNNSTYLTTYTLSLFLQGDPAAALATLDGAEGAGQSTASRVLHEAVYAAAAGQVERATELWPQLSRAYMLPEERTLAGGVRAAMTRPGSDPSRSTRLAGSAEDAAGPGWLASFPSRAGAATAEQVESDHLYREQRWPELIAHLRAGAWKDGEHLRQALLAYAQRNSARDEGSREAWRQAIAAAGRDGNRLRELETLAGEWSWADERIDAMANRFERETTDAEALAELLEHYRRRGQTADMARVLWVHVNETRATGTLAARCVYYSLLTGYNLSTAQTLARRAFDAAPGAAPERVAYAFALLRQQRAGEALPLLANLRDADLGTMQPALIEAAVLLELDRKAEARDALGRFIVHNALPEEVSLAETLGRRAGFTAQEAVLTLNRPESSGRL